MAFSTERRFCVIVWTFLAIATMGFAPQSATAEHFFGESGVPGDAFPDIFYYHDSGLLQVDTDDVGLVAVLVKSEKQFVHHEVDSPCILCEGDRLQNQAFAAGFINRSSQWIRTSPLRGAGPRGVIDLSAGFEGLSDDDFPQEFSPEQLNSPSSSSDKWSVVYASDRDVYFTNVTVVGGEGSGESMSPPMPLSPVTLPPDTDLPDVDPSTLSPWTNPSNDADVNGDSVIVAQDALILVNQLSTFGTRSLYGPQYGNFLDPTGDGMVSPFDAIYVINRINARSQAALSAGVTAVPEPTIGFAWWIACLVIAGRQARIGSA